MSELRIDDFRRIAQDAANTGQGGVASEAIRMAIRIREVERTFLDLFSRGLMNGTVHTCIGQEFSAVAVAGQLETNDWVTSNHRCHGHFIAKTGNWRGLIDELMGLESGVCNGIGSSQHLFEKGFLSNGPQGSLVPVATGIALQQKRSGSAAIAVSFIGEGTLGEGVLYEAMNLAAIWSVPQLIVCENNLYSQSTLQEQAVAGTIEGRARAFGLQYFEGNTWDIAGVIAVAKSAIDYVRMNSHPAMLVIRTYRLNAHSKGDDNRNKEEVEYFKTLDPLNLLLADDHWSGERARIESEIVEHVATSPKVYLDLQSYLGDEMPRKVSARKRKIHNDKIRLVHALNRAYKDLVRDGALLIGEDIHDPYGGAFKVTKGIAESYPENVFTTPISEAGIAGVGAGLALMGQRPFVEIMFGDFATNIFDQLVSNVSKLHHMYARQVSVPIRFRTPMGGKRGYGPTHSQSLEKFFLGIDNLTVLALCSLEDPAETLREIDMLAGPAFIIENKVEYGRVMWQGNEDYTTDKVGSALGTILVSPIRHQPTFTIVAYGEMAREIADNLKTIFLETDEVVELVVPVLLHPLDIQPVKNSSEKTGKLLVVEDGSIQFGFGAEVVSVLSEISPGTRCLRLGAAAVPIPSVLALEKRILPSVEHVIDTINGSRTD